MSGPIDLTGRVGIITGAGKGLGRAFALHVASLGASIVVNNRNRDVDSAGKVVGLIEAVGGSAVADYSDVAAPRTGERLVDLALSTYGRLDFCVTNAAVSAPAMFHKTSVEDFAAVQAVNVLGTAGVAAAVSRHLRAAGGGRIVLVASTAGLHGEPTVAAYAASKGAVIALGRTIAEEGAPRGVFTNVLLPYATTQMTHAGMAAEFRDAMSSDAVAPMVAALVDPHGTLNGEVIVTANGSLRATSSIEWGTVRIPPALDPVALAGLVAESRAGKPHEYRTAQDAFADFAGETL
jgi:NAD(P)-dependent dehydrogenase (short-subunit alcohol dehydrogenase family)